MKVLIPYLLFLFGFYGTLCAQSYQHTIIPEPVHFKKLQGDFNLSLKSGYRLDSDLAQNGLEYLQEHLLQTSGFTLHQDGTHNIVYALDTTLQDEAYNLSVQAQKIHIKANSSSGFFYATVTLMQLMNPKIWSLDKVGKVSWKIPAVMIHDTPRFKWRGLMLDSSRNFFSVQYIKKFIDRMAQHKLNVFHWHLTDDEGWRIEIKHYPLLTQIGAVRGPGTKLPFSFYPAMRGPKENVQKGFYTQEEIKDVVAYAAKRAVNILPEIDVPAHAKAAVTAYPELLQDPDDTSKYTSVQRVSNNTIDPGLKSSYIFLAHVIEEVTALFPFEYIHLGGDEVPKKAWSGSAAVNRLKKEYHLKNSTDVQAYFFSEMDKILAQHHRKLVAWQEANRVESQLRAESLFMAWKGDGLGVKIANTQHNVLFVPAQFLYFDQQYIRSKNEYGHTWAGPTDTKEVYSYQPLHPKILKQNRAYVKGVHACLWSERAPNEKVADYLVWPRALALSEVAWTPQKSRNWRYFQQKMQNGGLQRLYCQKVYYRHFPAASRQDITN